MDRLGRLQSSSGSRLPTAYEMCIELCMFSKPSETWICGNITGQLRLPRNYQLVYFEYDNGLSTRCYGSYVYPSSTDGHFLYAQQCVLFTGKVVLTAHESVS